MAVFMIFQAGMFLGWASDPWARGAGSFDWVWAVMSVAIFMIGLSSWEKEKAR